MTTKVIYFTIDGETVEKAEFSTDDEAEAIKDLFRSAAEADPYDIVKLYNSKGHLVNITSHLEDNIPEEAYKLVTVASNRQTLCNAAGVDVIGIEKRLDDLERRILVENGGVPENVRELSQQLGSLRSRLENIEHLSWIGLTKEVKGRQHKYHMNGSNWKKQIPLNHRHEDMCQKVFDHFSRMSYMEVKPEVRALLKGVNFNNWQWDDPEMLVLLKQMYEELDLLRHFSIPRELFHNWLCEVYKNYNRVPFHNFKHCFMVTQMMYGLINLLCLPDHMSKEDIFVLITSAICHDLDHPGYNNSYQVNAQTELALRYNDSSPLENHHCYVAFRILSKDECNILKHVSVQTYKTIRQGMIRCILATDMARHSEILEQYKSLVPEFSWDNVTHRNQLMMILIKCADISNECRPMEVAEPWIDCLLQEFFNQSDLEKKEGLPVSPFMDREKVNKNSSQVGFIQFVLLPLFETLALRFPQIQEPVIVPLQNALDYYRKLSSSPVEQLRPTCTSMTATNTCTTTTTTTTTATITDNQTGQSSNSCSSQRTSSNHNADSSSTLLNSTSASSPSTMPSTMTEYGSRVTQDTTSKSTATPIITSTLSRPSSSSVSANTSKFNSSIPRCKLRDNNNTTHYLMQNGTS